MKRIVIFLLGIVIIKSFNLHCQEFSFQMVFTDAIGNTDTLVLGYDENATDSLDLSFNEINIKDSALNSEFDVRITNEWKVISIPYRTPDDFDAKEIFHSKSQIAQKNCETWVTPFEIDFKCHNWPVTAKWDISSFSNNPCISGSVMAGIEMAGWWDIGTPSGFSPSNLNLFDSAVLSSNINNYFKENVFGSTSYINSSQDTISVFWIVIGSDELSKIGVNINEKQNEENIIVYPNPCNNKINVNITGLKNIEIADFLGKTYLFPTHENNTEIDVGNLPEGVYFLKLITNEGKILTSKFVKSQ